MSISYPLAKPASPAFQRGRLGGMTAVAISRSPFTYADQAQEHQGQMWRGAAVLPPMREADAAAWKAWLLALHGRAGTFHVSIADLIPDYAIRGAGGSLLVAGASQTGNTLAIDGGGATTLVLKAGDYFGLGTGSTARLYMVVEDATTNGAGEVTLSIWPRLRESPANNAELDITDPVGLFRLAANEAAFETEAVFRTFGLGFEFEEAGIP